MPGDTTAKQPDLEARLNRNMASGSLARHHEGIKMMALSERRDRAADILADGLARLMRLRTVQVEPPKPTAEGRRVHLKLVEPKPTEATT